MSAAERDLEYYKELQEKDQEQLAKLRAIKQVLAGEACGERGCRQVAGSFCACHRPRLAPQREQGDAPGSGSREGEDQGRADGRGT